MDTEPLDTYPICRALIRPNLFLGCEFVPGLLILMVGGC